ncbi:hypothetical protein [Pandoraea cepalis]|uniref:hypothetical protein n=1 Tax=Pandoraea cepalis TaxID=2508294 RepID=UPI00263A88B3|nr:hypothetical protein [Pandoraea cepalis]
MSDPKELETALDHLSKDPTAKSKIGRLRQLLPAIEKLHKSGVTHERICQTLRESGFDLSFTHYRQMLWRIRREAPQVETQAPESPKKESVPTTSASPPPETAKETQDVQSPAGKEEARPGALPKFDYAKHRDEKIKW